MGQMRCAGMSQLGIWGSPPDGEAPGPAARRSQGTGSRSGPQAQGPGGGVLRVLSITGGAEGHGCPGEATAGMGGRSSRQAREMAAWTGGVRTDTGGALNISVGVWPSTGSAGDPEKAVEGSHEQSCPGTRQGSGLVGEPKAGASQEPGRQGCGWPSQSESPAVWPQTTRYNAVTTSVSGWAR